MTQAIDLIDNNEKTSQKKKSTSNKKLKRKKSAQQQHLSTDEATKMIAQKSDDASITSGLKTKPTSAKSALAKESKSSTKIDASLYVINSSSRASV